VILDTLSKVCGSILYKLYALAVSQLAVSKHCGKNVVVYMYSQHLLYLFSAS